MYKTIIQSAVVSAFALAGIATAPAADAQEPKLVKAVPPEYPRAAERRQLEGYVTVAFSIDANGKVSGAEVVEADPQGVFDRSAIEAVEQWRFEAGSPTDGVKKKISYKLQ